MKYAFISDIHGNATALEAVLENIQKKEVDKIFVLGDLCFRGPEPKRSLEIIRSLNTDVIKGNADEWVVRGIHKGEVPEKNINIMNRERDWTYHQLEKEDIHYLENLPVDLIVEHGKLKIHCFHATPNSLIDVVQPSESDEIVQEKLMIEREFDLYVYAHIHKPFVRYINGKCIINTGSVGLPFDGLNMASYALLHIEYDYFEVSIVRVPYEVRLVIEKLKEMDYPNRDMMSAILMNGRI